MHDNSDWSKSLRVEVRGDDVVGHAGNVIPRMLADATGLTGALSAAVSRPEVTHDRGAVWRDVAVAIAGGAENLAGSAVLRDQARLFGPVASIPTMWRSLNELDHAALARIAMARNKTRERVWELIAARHGRIPPACTCYGDLGPVIVIRIDATLVTAHSDKECAAGNFKGGYGFHPLTAWCDNTGELLAIIARKGNAGSNTAEDHVAIIDAAIAAMPARWRRNLLVTIDGAGSSHAVTEHLTALNNRPGWSVAYSVGFDLDERGPHRDRPHPRGCVVTGARPGRRSARGRPGGRADRAAAGVRRRGPAGRLAEGYADPGAAGEDRARHPTVAVGTTQRIPLPGDRHGHPRRAGAAARGPPPGARPRRGIHPQRQGDRSRQVAVGGIRHQHRLGHRRRHRDRPAVLDPAAAPRRAAGQGRAAHAALPAAARRRPARLPLPQTDPPDPRNLALGKGIRRRIQPRPGHSLTPPTVVTTTPK